MGSDFELTTELQKLDIDEQKAVNAAIEAVENAYAPYSGYQVGAALLLENGEIVLGSNQENAAYPSGLCAERSALFAYGSNKRTSKIKILAIAAKGKDGNYAESCSPCGSCRQVMVEYEGLQKAPYKVIFFYEGKVQVSESSSKLLPFPFHF